MEDIYRCTKLVHVYFTIKLSNEFIVTDKEIIGAKFKDEVLLDSLDIK